MAIGDNLASFTDFFPNLRPDDGRITSVDDEYYNCFAWAACESKFRWEPGHVWLTQSQSMAKRNVVENYGYVGFEETDSSEYEEGFEKIAIYVNEFDEATHAARLIQPGIWTSKLGELEDIEHQNLECLECDVYGRVQIFLKRKEGDPQKWIETATSTRLKNSETSKS